jgi:hypothetical protein
MAVVLAGEVHDKKSFSDFKYAHTFTLESLFDNRRS